MNFPVRPTHKQTAVKRCATELGVIQISGEDVTSFMQGQLTCDLNQLGSDQWTFGGHCDSKGKLWSVFRCGWFNDTLLLIQPRSSIAGSLAQLQKFAVFSKVSIADASEHFHFALCLGENSALHQVAAGEHGIELGLGDATLEVSEQPLATDESSEFWSAYEIEHGVPMLTQSVTEQFVPQMVGLDRLGGINFKKGCYIGQETVARMHYLGQNKRALRQLTGEATNIPASGDQLERSMGDSWRRAGAVLNAVRYDSGEVAVLAVLPADIEDDATFRIKGEENSALTLCPTFDNQEIPHE
ncbi:YgfZ/GcvT domain-containing protein [Aliidiomarina sp. Khilg15.8]